LRKLLLILFALPLLAGLGWWYFHQRELASLDPAYHEYAYVTNGKSNTVSVIDLRTFRLQRTLHVGSGPTGIAANPKRTEVYAVNSGSANMSVIDAERNVVVGTVGVQSAPYFVDVSPDGRRAYVSNSGSNNVSVIDLDQRRVTATIRVGTSRTGARFAGWIDGCGQQPWQRFCIVH
jgi:YVTN family beta-propeller protein